MVIEPGEGRWDGLKQSAYQAASGEVVLYSRQMVYIKLVVVVVR
jgi:hypothetical protein